MLYLGTNDGKGFTAEEIERGLHWIHADIKCGHCGKEQPTIGCCKGSREGSAK